MQIEIISIGDEVLYGRTINQNAAFLSRILIDRGYQIARHTVVPDVIDKIQEVFAEAFRRHSFVIATGGLGTTVDDRTQEALKPFFPEKGQKIANSLGSAFGFFCEKFLLLPGVPAEMERMFADEALLLLQQRFPIGRHKEVKYVTLCLLREGEVDPFLRGLREKGVDVGIYPSYGSLQIRLEGEKALVADAVHQLAGRFPTFFIGEETLASAVHRVMKDTKSTLALAESCTGGAMAARLTALPKTSLFFLGALITYSNQWKERFLHVRHDTLQQKGAVSRETVREMIEGIFAESDPVFAVAVSGMLGCEKSEVFIGVAKRGGEIDIGRVRPPVDRASGIDFTVQTALGALWRRAAHNVMTFS